MNEKFNYMRNLHIYSLFSKFNNNITILVLISVINFQ